MVNDHPSSDHPYSDLFPTSARQAFKGSTERVLIVLSGSQVPFTDKGSARRRAFGLKLCRIPRVRCR